MTVIDARTRGERVPLTDGSGRWVLHRWSQWQGPTPSDDEVDREMAVAIGVDAQKHRS
jgi:hypothetical protein